MKQTMNLNNATPRRPHEAEPAWDRPYVHANILGPSKNVSHRRLNYTTWACGFLLFIWLVAFVWGVL